MAVAVESNTLRRLTRIQTDPSGGTGLIPGAPYRSK
jgi:hypothetical protein